MVIWDDMTGWAVMGKVLLAKEIFDCFLQFHQKELLVLVSTLWRSCSYSSEIRSYSDQKMKVTCLYLFSIFYTSTEEPLTASGR